MSQIRRRQHRRHGAKALAVAVAVLCGAGPAAASETGTGIDQRLAAAEVQVALLARQLGTDLTAGSAIIPVQTQLAQNNYAAEVEVRLMALEDAIRTLTGRVEELQYASRQSEDRLDRALNDIDYRLTELEGGDPLGAGSYSRETDTNASDPAETGSLGGGAGGSGAAGSGTTVVGGSSTSGSVFTPDAGSDASGNVVLDNSSGVLGTLVLEPGDSGSQVAVIQNDVTRAYERAYAFLQRRDLVAAESAFTEFLSRHSGDPLASNAYFWLGETHYQRGQFSDAAEAFARGYEAFPRGDKAIDSLLKLGMSLAQLGQQQNACLTFDELAAEFPNAPLAIQRRAQQERQRLACG